MLPDVTISSFQPFATSTTLTCACRICVVEVKGAWSLMPSCATLAAGNMVVLTESSKVIEVRRMILQMFLHVKDNRVVKVTGVEGTPPNHGSLCVKGRFGFNFIHSPERLTTPLIKENGEFRTASWDEALSLVAGRLGEIKAAHGPDSIGVLTSARITNEENYIASKFTRAVLKTNNIDHCARL